MQPQSPAVHRTIVVVDVERFGDRRRTNPHQVVVRDALYQALQQALAEAGVGWAVCRHEDRGDGVLILAPAEIPKAPFVDIVPRALAAALGEHNGCHPVEEQIRLRMALHAGEVQLDRHGVTSTSVNLTFRLLDARPLKSALADSPGVLALITSGWFFEDVVRHSPAAQPETFRPVRVAEKETSTVAWIALPDHPYPPDLTALTTPPPEPAAGPMPHPLPTPAGSFTGRRNELTTAVNAVAGPGRPGLLVTAWAPPVNEQLRLLARASWTQWTAAANDRRLVHPAPLPIRWRRSMAPVAGPDSATRYPRFDPLPGLTAVSGSGLGEGNQDALRRLYGGLPSGRLLLIGKPGSGKTAAAILLLLDALRHREQATPDEQAQIPVPVLFTLHDWHPDSGKSVTDWMVSKLAETYPMFRSRAARHAATALLTAGRVAGFLDGLDELPTSVRPRALEALADAPFRLVVLSRTAEAVDAANHGPLAGAVAVELQPVTPTDAATYLLQPLVNPPPTPWRTIRDHLAGSADHRQRTTALSEALTTPLALSLLRDVYGPTGPVHELLDSSRFPTAADIENHLLDQAVTAAYTPRPGHPTPRYTVATAHRTLTYLATRLTEQHTSDLAWWNIPTWTPHRSRLIMVAVTSMLANTLIYGLALGLVFGPAIGLLAGLVFGLISFIALSAANSRAVPIMPQRIARLTYRSTARSLAFGLMAGLAGGLLAGMSAGLMFGLSVGLVSGLSLGLVSGLASVALHGIVRHTDIDESSLGPADIWRHDINAGLAYTLVMGLMIGLLAVLTVRLVPGLASGLASRISVVLSSMLLVGLVVGLVVTVIAKRMGTAASSPGAAATDTALAAMRLTIRHKTPLRLIAFLEDARRRHLLRTVGPVYQFRHAKLQDRLAQPPPEGLSRIEESP
jgi:hypothetical protein